MIKIASQDLNPQVLYNYVNALIVLKDALRFKILKFIVFAKGDNHQMSQNFMLKLNQMSRSD